MLRRRWCRFEGVEEVRGVPVVVGKCGEKGKRKGLLGVGD